MAVTMFVVVMFVAMVFVLVMFVAMVFVVMLMTMFMSVMLVGMMLAMVLVPMVVLFVVMNMMVLMSRPVMVSHMMMSFVVMMMTFHMMVSLMVMTLVMTLVMTMVSVMLHVVVMSMMFLMMVALSVMLDMVALMMMMSYMMMVLSMMMVVMMTNSVMNSLLSSFNQDLGIFVLNFKCRNLNSFDLGVDLLDLRAAAGAAVDLGDAGNSRALGEELDLLLELAGGLLLALVLVQLEDQFVSTVSVGVLDLALQVVDLLLVLVHQLGHLAGFLADFHAAGLQQLLLVLHQPGHDRALLVAGRRLEQALEGVHLADLHLLGLLDHRLGVAMVDVDLWQTTAVDHGDGGLGALGDLGGFLLLLAGLALAHLHLSLYLGQLLDQVHSLRALGLRKSDL